VTDSCDDDIASAVRRALLSQDSVALELALSRSQSGVVVNSLIDGVFPLHAAAAAGFASGVEVLLRHGADARQRDADGVTALHLAATSEPCPRIAQCLLDAGADVNAKSIRGSTPLDVAIAVGTRDAQAFLIAANGCRGRDGCGPCEHSPELP
jgi:ankyrin repeat protein